MSKFSGVKVVKRWGNEHEVFNNGIVAAWYLKIESGQQTSLHMHEHKETAMIMLSGSALLQEGLMMSRPITALDKTRFGSGFFHRHSAINGPCELLEIEYPIDKEDLYRFKDSYGREGKPYESVEDYAALESIDPQFVNGAMKTPGGARLRIVEFLKAENFSQWITKLPERHIVVLTRGSLRSRHGKEVVRVGHANWSQNIRQLQVDLIPEDRMQAILVYREDKIDI